MDTEERLRLWAGGILSRQDSLPVLPPVPTLRIRKFLVRNGATTAICFAGRQRGDNPFPADLSDLLDKDYRHSAGVELIHAAEFARVMRHLSAHLRRPIVVFKGTALAYQLYAEPHLRTREDTDILVEPGIVGDLAALLEDLGYSSPVAIDGSLITQQRSLTRTDSTKTTHIWDVHWKLSNRPGFADILSLDEILHTAVEVKVDDTPCLAPDRVNGLLIACLHLIGHHSSDIRLMWLYDIHLLIGSLSESEHARFVEKAASGAGIRSACHAAIALAQRYLPSHRTDELRRLVDPGEGNWRTTSQSYAAHLIEDGRALKKGERLRFIGEHLFPSPGYMMKRFGIRRRWQLPFWYLLRICRALPKLFWRR